MRTHQRRRKRRGTILAVSLALLTVVMLMGVALAKNMLLFHRQSKSAEFKYQAAWLAEAGAERAVRAIRNSPEYQGETWRPSAGLPEEFRGVVDIRVEKEKIIVKASYPENGHPTSVSVREIPRGGSS